MVIISVDSGGGLVAQTGVAGPNKTIDLFLSQAVGASDLFAGNTAGQCMLGDVNVDGVVSFLDIAPFIAVLAGQ